MGIPCAVLAIEASFPQFFRRGPAWAPIVMRIAFVLFRLMVATCVESFVALSALVSSVFCVCNNILIPVIAFHWTGVKQVGLIRKIMHVLIILYGCVIMVLGTASAIAALSPRALTEPGTAIREGISVECMTAFHKINGSTSGI